jgi:hypothetical protein
LIFPHLVSQRRSASVVSASGHERPAAARAVADGAARHIGARHKQSCLGYSMDALPRCVHRCPPQSGSPPSRVVQDWSG